MKTAKKSTVSKLVNRFDNELRAIILADLIAVKRLAQSVQGKSLSAA